MQRGRGGRDDLFGGYGNPFTGFPGFGGRPGSLMSSNGRDPFHDPFFTQPFGSMMGPSMLGPSGFPPPGFGFGETVNSGFLERPVNSQANNSRRPVIEEILSDEEAEENEEAKRDNQRKKSRSSKEPYVQDPDEEVEERSIRSVQPRREFNRAASNGSHGQTYSFQSSNVTYGGASGAYYTASTTRRMGGDGVVMEESKEANSTTGKATQRVLKGIHDKGHTVTRKLNPDGRVDSLQTLHNLNEDELGGFHEAWKGEARQHLPGLNEGYDMLANGNTSGSRNGRIDGQRALPSMGNPSTSSATRKPESQFQ